MIKIFGDAAINGNYDVHVVGAGPIGIALALACEARGLSVLLLESGLSSPSPSADALSAGHEVDLSRHASPNVSICRNLGGTSRWWGGRCVAFDEVDFSPRPHIPDALWPIPHAEVERWYRDAAEYLGIGSADFKSPISPWSKLQDVNFDDLERWTPVTNMATRHEARLTTSVQITVLLGANVTALNLSDDGQRVSCLKISGAGRELDLTPSHVVLACGGLETTRLLLNTKATYPTALGGQAGALGHYYMGHVSGKISDIVLSDPAEISAHDYFLDAGAYARRRFSVSHDRQQQEELLNVSFWADNPSFHAFEHRNGVLSLVWLALAIPFIGRLLVSEGVRQSHVGNGRKRILEHLWNIFRQPIATLNDILKILHARFISRPPKPGFLVRGGSGRYALHYHAEQSPSFDSAVRLSDRLDPMGVPYLHVDLRFDTSDAKSILRSHDIIDSALRRAELGHLEYYQEDPTDRLASIMSQATDGFHQIGTTRMGAEAVTSVVDKNCRVHGISNLHIASSSVFPTSGQANPTFLAVALAIRLANHLADAITTSTKSERKPGASA